MASLARQRKLVISNNEAGEVVFRKSASTGAPVANLTQGAAPLVRVDPNFDGQEYYSSVTGVEPTLFSVIAGDKLTVQNPHLNGVVRPFTFEVGDSPSGSLQDAVDSKIGRMFGSLASYSVTVSTWRDPSGTLWRENTFINLTAADAMVYNQYKFLIRGVEFFKNSNKTEARLNLIMPGAFSGEIPDSLPWG